jgi:phosphopantothenoylcysteine decarboxylase/phosphopantothenate--cysteine ligase
MFAAVRKTVAELRGRNVVLVATAAVADWRPRKCAAKKLKKSAMSGTLELVRNPDILKTAKGVRKVGFAAETGDAIAEAARKCREKNLEFIVANDVTRPGAGFGTDTNLASFVYPDGRVRELALMSKRALAGKIVDEVLRA